MSPSPRAAVLLAGAALLALAGGPVVGVGAALVVLATVLVDAWAVREAPGFSRQVAPVLARGVASPLVVDAAGGTGTVLVRQPLPPDLRAEERQSASGRLETSLVARRRGRHVLEPAATRREGPLGLGRWHHRPGDSQEILVYPDFPAARRLARAVRQGAFREAGLATRGPLGLGTDFESIRDYVPDDDIRQVNWPATQRMGRPMSNQYRVEQDRELVLLLDSGRLMASPIGEATRLDVCVDAAVAIGLVADAVGDRCGAIAFDREIRRRLPPRRAGGAALTRALFDLEPRIEEPDYELAFRAVEGGKRSLVVVFCDLIEEAAARPLVDAVPVIARRHFVVVATPSDPELVARSVSEPSRPVDAYAAAVALQVLAARTAVARDLERAGAVVIEAAPGELGPACVRAYLRAKARARL